MASNTLPAAHHAALEIFHADTRRLDRRDWQLWSIAALVMLAMFSTIAVLALEIEHRGMEYLSGAQLDAAVRGLLVMVLLFTLFVVYQQFMLTRLRQVLVQDLRRELAASREIARSEANE